jgi:hypothetical protein
MFCGKVTRAYYSETPASPLNPRMIACRANTAIKIDGMIAIIPAAAIGPY